jgi:2',3'-cyclic-nucleotide 2'-phosphodiesterase (5'-nucleotidase family)
MSQVLSVFPSETIYHNEEQTSTKGKKLNIIHFNDVYNIESSLTDKVCGGASRFVTTIESLINNNNPTVVLFSGDAISPSSS